MKSCYTYILSKDDQMKIFGKTLSFRDGFVNEPKLDWWNILEEHFHRPIISVRQSGRESWDEIFVFMAQGWISTDGIRILDYDNEHDLEKVLMDIFCEAENDEYEVFEQYKGNCSKKVWDNVAKWVHSVY